MTINHLLIIPFFLITILIVLYLLWLIIPSLAGLPWIPTRPQRILRALELANLSPGDLFYDLGSGDGRTLILAARKFGAHAIGVEISPIHCLVSWINVRLHGLSDRVKIKWSNFYKVDLCNANVVFVYLTTMQASRLRPHLESQLQVGSRVITVSCEIAGWQLAAFDREELIYLYLIGSESPC